MVKAMNKRIYIGLVCLAIAGILFCGKNTFALSSMESGMLKKWMFVQYYNCAMHYVNSPIETDKQKDSAKVSEAVFISNDKVALPSLGYMLPRVTDTVKCNAILNGENDIAGVLDYYDARLKAVTWSDYGQAQNLLETLGYVVKSNANQAFKFQALYSTVCTSGAELCKYYPDDIVTDKVVATVEITISSSDVGGKTCRVVGDLHYCYGSQSWSVADWLFDYASPKLKIQFTDNNKLEIYLQDANDSYGSKEIELKADVDEFYNEAREALQNLMFVRSITIGHSVMGAATLQIKYDLNVYFDDFRLEIINSGARGDFVYPSSKYSVIKQTIKTMSGIDYSALKFNNDEIYTLYFNYLDILTRGRPNGFTCSPSSVANLTPVMLLGGENGEKRTCYANLANHDLNKKEYASPKYTGDRYREPYTYIEYVSLNDIIDWLGSVDVSTLGGVADLAPNSGVDYQPDQPEPDPCYENSGSLGWVLCPILDKVSEALDGLYTNAVEPFLVVNPELVSSNSGTYNAWQIMIGIANILVVIFLLVVIFSQLTGIGIDNYGIKKVLPKIIAAAILVNLSYIICQLAVDLSNILGNSLNSFLSNIEVSGLNSSLSLDGVSTEIQVSSDNAAWFKGLFTVAGGGLVGVGTVALAMSVVNSGWFAGLVLPILLFFVVALVAVLFFFILLGVRKAGVVILVVLAPLAFVCYMLPNTKKWFDKWLKAFEGLLLLYPICGLLIGGGQLVSKILLTVSDDYIMYFTGCIVLVVPFFFIPTLLKGSFVAMGNIGAKISGFGKALGARGRGRLDGAVRGSNWFKSHQAEIARQNQERTASRTVRRLNAKRDRNGGELNARDTRRLARSQESLDKLQREDRAARTVLSESEFANRTMPELQTAWEEAFDSGDTERLDALTNVLTMKYGSGGAKFIGDALSRKRVVTGVDASGRQMVNQNYVRSLRALQDNMNHNSNFAGNMKNKASDAYAMISNAGMYHNDATGQNEYRDLSHFSANNNISTDLKDWSTQSASTLQRAIDSGALSDEMVESLLSSTDPSIQSGIQSDAGKRDVLQARMYNMAHNPSGVGPSLPAGTAAQQYRAEQARTQNENELFISHERDAERIGKTTITVSPGSVITGAPAVTFEGYAVPAGFNTGGSAPVRNADGHWIYKDSSTNREWNATTGRYMPPSTP